MEWSDDAIVLSLKPHGESSGILEALTREHGRHLGLVRGGGASQKMRATLQPGNRVRLVWRARLSDHLGVFTAELAQARASRMFERRASLIGLNAFSAMAAAALPEREPHGPAFEGAEIFLDAIAGNDFADWAPLYVRWEMGILEELGFGLDLARCAGTGATDDLVYVSPRTGRAVSRNAGEEYRDRLFALPQFLLGRQAGSPHPADIVAGLHLTTHFLDRWVLAPHGRTVPEARQRLIEMAARHAAESV